MIPNAVQISHTVAMRRDDICLYLSRSDRARLEAIINDHNSKAKVIWRAEIVLATADGHGTNEIMRRTGMSKPSVWRWQERYIEEGVDGLLRDKTRPSRIAPLSEAVKLAVLTKTATEEPVDPDRDTRTHTASKSTPTGRSAHGRRLASYLSNRCGSSLTANKLRAPTMT
jgi:transposase